MSSVVPSISVSSYVTASMTLDLRLGTAARERDSAGAAGRGGVSRWHQATGVLRELLPGSLAAGGDSRGSDGSAERSILSSGPDGGRQTASSQLTVCSLSRRVLLSGRWRRR